VGVKYSNNASTSLPSGISDSVTAITVADASSFPTISSPDYAYLTLVSSTALEVVKCTNITGNVLTVVRAQESTSAAAFVTDDRVELRVTTAMLTDALAETVAAAAASASAAATSATAAATSYDNFDDRWLGSKSSNPSVDNDGATLLDGAAYFNTTNNVLMVYDLGGTTWNSTTPSSSDQTKINTVAGIAADVSSVAADATDIGAVAAKATEIGRLGTADAVADMAILGTADVVTDMNTLGTADVVADMNTLGTADVVSDMNTLATADVVTDMNTLGTADVVADMNTLGTADVVADMNTLGTADVVNDMNVLGTSGNVTNMNTLAGISANITTVAGISANVTTVAGASANVTTVATNVADVNRYSDEYTIASSAPGSPSEGDLWYDSSNNVLKVHNGTSFVAVTSATAGITDVVDDSTPQLGGDLDLNGNDIPASESVKGFSIAMAICL
jgi:hypothetical protein